jgi:hypothetical protein
MADEPAPQEPPVPPSPAPAEDAPRDEDELVDEMEQESFPASDPPSTWAGPSPG